MNTRLIRIKGAAAILESEDGVERRIVPIGAIRVDGAGRAWLSDEDWQRGAEYGIEWDNLPETICVPVAALRDEFRRRGLWSAADIFERQRLAREALLSVAGDILSRIVELDRGG